MSHIIAHQLDRCDDETVWRFAKSHGWTIVTKDQDYQVFSFMWGHPPKVIWLRSGNGPTRHVLDLLLRSQSVIEAFEADEERSLLVLP